MRFSWRGDGTYKHVTATSGALKGAESMRTWKELLHLLAASGMQACRFTERPLAEWPEYVRSDALRGCYWRIMNFQLLLRRVYPRRRVAPRSAAQRSAVMSVGTHCRRRLIHFEFRWTSLQKAKTEQSCARARQMLAEAQATWDNGTSCSYIRHNSWPRARCLMF